jgi:hypothetical protein
MNGDRSNFSSWEPAQVDASRSTAQHKLTDPSCWKLGRQADRSAPGRATSAAKEQSSSKTIITSKFSGGREAGASLASPIDGGASRDVHFKLLSKPGPSNHVTFSVSCPGETDMRFMTSVCEKVISNWHLLCLGVTPPGPFRTLGLPPEVEIGWDSAEIGWRLVALTLILRDRVGPTILSSALCLVLFRLLTPPACSVSLATSVKKLRISSG